MAYPYIDPATWWLENQGQVPQPSAPGFDPRAYYRQQAMQSPAMGLARGIAPNITSVLSGDPAAPPAMLPDMPGKVPSNDDPRVTGSIPEWASLATLPLSFTPMGMAQRAPALAGRLLPRMGASAPRAAPESSAAYDEVMALLNQPSAPLTSAERAGVRANDLRRSLGVTARTEGGRQTDDVLRTIDDALLAGSPATSGIPQGVAQNVAIGTLGGGAMASPAGASPMPRPRPEAPPALMPQDAGPATDARDPRVSEINRLTQQLQKNEAEIIRLGTTRTPSPKGTQDKTIDTLKDSVSRDTKRLTDLQTELRDEATRNREAGDLRTREERDAADKKRQAEMGIRERFPWVGPAATAGAPALGLLTGAVAGRGTRLAGGSKVGSMVGAGVGGAAEGAVLQFLQTELDAAGLPRTSQAQQQATADLQDPNYWMTRVLPAAGASGAMGVLGAKYGYGWPRKAGSPTALPGGQPVPAPAGAPQAQLSPPTGLAGLGSPATRIPSAPPALGMPSPPRKTFTDAAGRLRYADDGRFAPRGQ